MYNADTLTVVIFSAISVHAMLSEVASIC